MIATRKATALVWFVVLGLMLAAMLSILDAGGDVRVTVGEPSPHPSPVDGRGGQSQIAPILPAVTLDVLLTEVEEAHGARLATRMGSEGVRSSVPADPSATPHLLAVEATPGGVTAASALSEAGSGFESRPGDILYGSLAACGPDCWGRQMSRGEVEQAALEVTGNAAWSAWAGRCFTGGGENRGYVGAVGGPNHHSDGGISWDLGVGQNNTRTLAALGYDAARVIVDAWYALEGLYATFLAQGYGAWLGC